MWLFFECTADAEKERAMWTNGTTERDGEAYRGNKMTQKAKVNAPGTEED